MHNVASGGIAIGGDLEADGSKIGWISCLRAFVFRLLVCVAVGEGASNKGAFFDFVALKGAWNGDLQIGAPETGLGWGVWRCFFVDCLFMRVCGEW